MVRSPRSRGKGSRRRPWREGGAKQRKPGLPTVKPTARPPVVYSSWHEIEPLPLSKAYRDHPWVFAVYEEWNRPDGKPYRAFLFRNGDRTVFGIREWFALGEPAVEALRKLAH